MLVPVVVEEIKLESIKRNAKKIAELEKRPGVWVIYCGQHGAYSKPENCGYTTSLLEAWSVSFREAYDCSYHCGTEKHVEYHRIEAQPPESPAPERSVRQWLQSQVEALDVVVVGANDTPIGVVRPEGSGELLAAMVYKEEQSNPRANPNRQVIHYWLRKFKLGEMEKI